MQCVYYESDFPNGFEEQFVFSAEMPYTINVKRFQTEDIVPLHYAETLEMLLCDGLCGEIVIDTNRYSLRDQQLFVIPPYTVHANNIRPGGGIMYVFKVCFREMDRYVNISNCLRTRGCGLNQLQYLCPEYSEVKQILQELIRRDVICAAICQQPEVQGALPLQLLFDYLATGQQPEKEFYYTAVDIRIRENL